MNLLTIALRELCKQRGLKYVGTRGNTTAPIVYVGEAPGADEDANGYPFVGASGRLADKMLAEAGFNLQDIWFTNPYKVRPPNNELERLHELGIPLNTYEDQFFEELNDTKPTIIIPAGATPLKLLCPGTRSKKSDETPIGRWRGSLLTSPRLQWPHYIIPIYHPAFLLRDWSEKDTDVFVLRKIFQEFQYYKAQGRLQPLPERELIVEPSGQTAIDYLVRILNDPNPVSIDIELLRRKIPYTISLALSPSSAISICLWDYGDSVAVRIWRLIDEILRIKRQIGQNYTSFDCHWLYRLSFNINGLLVDDTRIRHNVLWPELSHKLEFMVMQYTREPFYKDEGQGWTLKDSGGKAQLMRYNCKDSACTYEVYNEQEEELKSQPNLYKLYYEHEKPLGGAFFNIERRGVLVDENARRDLRRYIDTELEEACKRSSTIVGKPVSFNKITAAKMGPTAINLNSPAQVIELLKQRGLKVPKKRGTGKESSGEEELNTLFAESNDPVLKEILNVRELNKIGGTYVNAKLVDSTMYCVYIVGGTVGGRRSSKANPLGFGTNHQNQPKHSRLGKKFRACLVARPGKIFVQCDQVAAEDWIINGIIADLTGDRSGINELESGIDRHQKLASYIFGVPLDQCSRESPFIYRYVGKRTRYAGSYGMGGDKFAAVLAKEGFSVPTANCNFILSKFHDHDPGIRGVFQAYVEKTLTDTRRLRDLWPFERERVFFGLHPFRDNSKIFREAYSYIPQSTVGDNNGEAILFVERHLEGPLLMETHDSMVLEVDDNLDTICSVATLMEDAYRRVLRFPKGFELTIPIKIELGYNLNATKECENSQRAGLQSTYLTLTRPASPQSVTISGAPSEVSVQL